MNGELILSSYTYDQGRVALNDSFSATATFNNVLSTGNLTGETYYSGATPLELIIQSFVGGGSTYAANGLTKNGDTIVLGGTLSAETTIHLSGNNFTITGDGLTTDVMIDTTRVGIGPAFINSDKLQVFGKATFTDNVTSWSNFISSISNTTTGLVSGGGNIVAGIGNSALTTAYGILMAAGKYSTLDNTEDSFILGGSGHTVAGGKNKGIINGYNNYIPASLENVVMIGTTALTATDSNTVYLPNVNAVGNLTATTFYSGSTPLQTILNSLSGGTSGDLFSASTGTNSIIANNGTGNAAGGNYAIALGLATTASGTGSTAVGGLNTAQGGYSFAGGTNSTAGGVRSFAFGQTLTATGTNSVAFGQANTVSNSNALAFGQTNTASGSRSFVGGLQSYSTAEQSFAFGLSVSGNGTASFAIGQLTKASGPNSIATGLYTEATASSSFAGGFGNSSSILIKSQAAAAFNFSRADSSYSGNGIGTSSAAAAILGGTNQEIDGVGSSNSAILGGNYNIISGAGSTVILGGYNNIAGLAANYGAIVGGNDSFIQNGGNPNVIMLGTNARTGDFAYTTYVENLKAFQAVGINMNVLAPHAIAMSGSAYVDGFLELVPQTVMPTATAGRVFYSGAPLNRLIVFTGASAGDYMVLN